MMKRDIEKVTEKMMKREYRKGLKNWWTVNTEKGLKGDEQRIQKSDRKRWREITKLGLKNDDERIVKSDWKLMKRKKTKVKEKW